ncbi:MAG TPA: universal stress protein, UspA [Gammaproteobacteria bacterium]|nr:universal stress protein, UspA [Gammaproteobacteria bacterium]
MKRFKNILCVVKPGEACKPTLARAVTLAKNNQARLTVVDVVERIMVCVGMPEGGSASADLQAALVKDRAQELETLVEPYREQIEINTNVLIGTPFLEIIREVLRNGRDLVIKIPEHQEWLERLFGSDDMHLLRKCPCPVWLIKPHAPKTHRHILAAVDIDDAYPQAEQESRRALNQQVLEMASSLALSDFAELHIAHAWVAIGESAMHGAFMHEPEERIIAYVEQVRQQHQAGLDGLKREVTRNLGQDAVGYLKPQTHLVKGSARKEIPALAKRIEADLVVMGTVARTGVPGFFMGNTAETILNQIDCSVLAIKPPGFVTPVTLEE